VDVVDNIQEYIEPYVTFDEPIPYKGLYLYPVKMKDVYKFLASVDILNIEKNKIADIQIIQMNYLQFLFNIVLSDIVWRKKLLGILTLCLKAESNETFEEFPEDEVLVRTSLDRTVYLYNGWDIRFEVFKNNQVYLYVNNIEIDGKSFDELRKIIMFQNVNEYDDAEMSDDFKEVVENYYKIKNKGMKSLTIEDKIDVVMSQTSYTKDDIKEISYRNFDRIFNKIIEKTEYVIGKIAEMQGCTKEPTEHWVYKKDKNKYSHIFSDADAFTNEIVGVH